jgi:hypothetical protein
MIYWKFSNYPKAIVLESVDQFLGDEPINAALAVGPKLHGKSSSGR